MEIGRIGVTSLETSSPMSLTPYMASTKASVCPVVNGDMIASPSDLKQNCLGIAPVTQHYLY
jgi:hypothetical protein